MESSFSVFYSCFMRNEFCNPVVEVKFKISSLMKWTSPQRTLLGPPGKPIIVALFQSRTHILEFPFWPRPHKG